MMDDCEIPVQMNETIFSSMCNNDSNDIGMLILEELRCFRKEMREEVRKLQANVHNFLFSKADIVNAILGSSTLFSEIDKVVDTTFSEESQPVYDATSNVQKSNEENHRTIIKFQPTRVEVIKSQSQHPTSVIESSNKPNLMKNIDDVDAQKKSEISGKVTSSANSKMSKIVNDFVSNKSDNNLPKMEVQVLQFNGNPSTSTLADEDENESCEKYNLSRNFPLTKQFKSKLSLNSLSGLSIPHKTILLPHHATPKLPSKYGHYLGKLKSIRSSDKTGYGIDRKFAMKAKNKCKFCHRSFVSSNDLKRHIRVHTGDRPFQCTECPKAYTRNDHLKRHMKQKHLLTFMESEAASVTKISDPNT